MGKKYKLLSKFKKNNRESVITESVFITILRKNPTNPLTTLFTLSHCFMFHPAKGPASGSTDTYCEQGQQYTCQDVNIKLKGSVLNVTWQLSINFKHAAAIKF